MKSLSDIFGIETISADIYRYALTHSSYTKENSLPETQCYERLEFLGDAVLKLTISDLLYKIYSEANEGFMSNIRSFVVSDNTLAEIAKENGLDELIILGKHEEKLGYRKNNSICACVFEAVLGAYYLDGKIAEIKSYIEKTFIPYIKEIELNLDKYNAKAILQEYTQSIDKTRPEYKVISESGPAHKRIFEVAIIYNGEILAVEKGYSKKEAEQKSAYEACKKLEIIK